MNNILQLDTTNLCNLSCIFCYKGKDQHKEDLFLSLEKIENIFNNTKKIQGISLINNGEFFLHPEYKKILEFTFAQAEKRKINYISLNTNGTMLSAEIQKFILDLCLKYKILFRITFSLNANTKETYLKLTGKDLLDIVVKNISDFILKIKKSGEEIKIVCAIQSLILPENKYEIEDFIRKWETFYQENNISYDICEDIYNSDKNFLITLRRYFSEDHNNHLWNKVIKVLSKKFNIQTSKEIEDSSDYFKRRACAFLFEYPALNNEDVTICCRDTFFKYKYKKIGESENILEKYYKYSHIFGNFKNIELCRTCYNYTSASDNTISEYLKDPKLINLYRKRLINGTYFDLYDLNSYSSDMDENNYMEMENIKPLFSKNKDAKSYFHGIYKGKKYDEIDFCTAWFGNIKLKNGKVYTGCTEIDIPTGKYSDFILKLKNHDLSVLPIQCLNCNRKFSYNRKLDRYILYKTDTFSSPIIPDKESSTLETLLFTGNYQNNSFTENILNKLNNIEYHKNFLAFIINENFDASWIYELFRKTENFFLIVQYALYTEINFEKTIEFLIWKYKYTLPMPVFFKLCEFYYENRISKIDIIKYIETNILKLKNHKELYNQKDDEWLLEKILIKNIECTKDENQIVTYFMENSSFLKNKAVYKAFNYKILNFMENSDLQDSLTLFKKHLSLSEDFKNTHQTLQHKIIQDIENGDIIKVFKQIIENKMLNPLYKGAFSYEFTNLLKRKKFNTLYKLIKTNSDYFKENTEDINNILLMDFSEYSIRFIHFLIGLSTILNKDKCNHLIFSFYMNKNNYKKALFYFNRIKRPSNFWEKEEYKNTCLFLYKRNLQLLKYLKTRLSGNQNSKNNRHY